MKKPFVIEVINFLHELDLLEAHLDEHQHFIDKIVIIESEMTYSGMSKPLYFLENKDRFSRFNVEHEVFPSDSFTKIPGRYSDDEHKHWFDVRRENREIQQHYLYQKYRKEADYVCNTDVDEIWSRNHYDAIYDMMKDENCYISPRIRRFMYYADAIARTQDYWRITKSTQNSHVREKGTKRGGTQIEVGWHFTSMHPSAWGIWMKGIGLAQSIGYNGWETVESPEEIQGILDRGEIPFLYVKSKHGGPKRPQKLSDMKRVQQVKDLSYLPPFLYEHPEYCRWIPDKFRGGIREVNWKVGQPVDMR
jgi:hypothetical protein